MSLHALKDTSSSTCRSETTMEQLRSDIDTGRAKDKIAFLDPAAVPLGADEEAAGTPSSSIHALMSREYEIIGREHIEVERDSIGRYFWAIALAFIFMLSIFYILTA